MEQQYIPSSDEARAMPCHPESERSVLGAMLRSREAALLAVENLRPDDFYDPANREIYSAMQSMASVSRPIDLVTLDEEMTRRGRLDAVGGTAYLIELSQYVPSSSNVEAYIKIVDQKATLRRLIAAAIFEESRNSVFSCVICLRFVSISSCSAAVCSSATCE